MRTNKNQLMRIFRNAGPCDAVNFKQNIEMATNEDFTFSKQSTIKKGMDNQVNQLGIFLNRTSAYAKEQSRMVFQDTHNYKFKKTMLDSSDYYEGQGSLAILTDKDRFLKSSFGAKSKEKYDLMTADLKFDINAVNNKYLRKNEKVRKEVKNKISLRHIEMIGSTEFLDGCNHLEEYYDIVSDLKAEPVKNDPRDKQLCDYMVQRVSTKFKFRDLKKGIETKLNEIYSIQFTRDLSIHPEIFNYDIPVVNVDKKKYLKVDSDITKEHIFEISARVHRIPQIQTYIQKMAEERKNMVNIEHDNELEARMDEIKAKIKVYRDKRKEKKDIKTNHNQTQTERIIFQEDIKDVISLSDKLLMDKIEKISSIKEAEIQSGKNPNVVYGQLNPTLNQYLYRLLLIVASGEEFISWSDYLLFEDEQTVEKMVLAKLYKFMYMIDNKCSPSGMNKMQLLLFYTTHKLKIQKQGTPQINKRYARVANITKTPKQQQQKQKSLFEKSVTSKSLKKIGGPSMMSSQNVKSFLRSTKNFNETTKQNTTNFNLTKKSMNENIESKIDGLFKNENERTPIKKESASSPLSKKSTWAKIAKTTRNPFANKDGTLTPRR